MHKAFPLLKKVRVVDELANFYFQKMKHNLSSLVLVHLMLSQQVMPQRFGIRVWLGSIIIYLDCIKCFFMYGFTIEAHMFTQRHQINKELK